MIRAMTITIGDAEVRLETEEINAFILFALVQTWNNESARAKKPVAVITHAWSYDPY